MKVIHVTEAIGMILGHDLTKIEPGKFKGVVFKKGHIIKPEDIPIGHGGLCQACQDGCRYPNCSFCK